MAKYISVLNGAMGYTFWKAVQWSDSLAEIRNNGFYTAGVFLSLPKNAGDSIIEDKSLVETNTGTSAQAKIIKLSSAALNSLRYASGTASAALIRKAEKNIK